MAQQDEFSLDDAAAELLAGKAGQVFQPRTPINRRDFFAGRWDQLTTIVDAVAQVGLHVVIYGERGVGKTSIANVIRPLLHAFDRPEGVAGRVPERLITKVNANSEDTFTSLWRRALDEIELENVREQFGFAKGTTTRVSTLVEYFQLPDLLTIDTIRKILGKLPGSVFVFDEFDRLPKKHAKPFTDLIKSLSDYAINSTIIIVGVSQTVDELIADHASIGRALIQVPMPRMTSNELEEILQKSEEALRVKFDEAAMSRIVRLSQGLPHYTHLVGLESIRAACDDRRRLISGDHANKGFVKAVKNADHSVRTKYGTAIHSAHPDALYQEILLASAIAAYAAKDDQGFFQAVHVVGPLTAILGRDVQISTFNKHLAEFCEDRKRGEVLERVGQPRSYRYRFRDPLLPPYIMMKGLAAEMITPDQMWRLASS
jgi:Cdc6-like AAA superfamily ATPase